MQDEVGAQDANLATSKHEFGNTFYRRGMSFIARDKPPMSDSRYASSADDLMTGC